MERPCQTLMPALARRVGSANLPRQRAVVAFFQITEIRCCRGRACCVFYRDFFVVLAACNVTSRLAYSLSSYQNNDTICLLVPTHVSSLWLKLSHQEGLKRILQDFSGIEQATVEYSTWNSNSTNDLLLGSRGVCSDNGTTVTVTFDRISMEVGGWEDRWVDGGVQIEDLTYDE